MTGKNHINRHVFMSGTGGILTGLIVFCLILGGIAADCEAMIFFYKQPYNGRIIDMDTKEPIEGVVVVAVYGVESIIGGPAGGWSKDIHAREVLTDKDGYFHIPSYTTLVGLNSRADRTEFIIFKPGYASYPEQFREIAPFKYCVYENSGYFPSTCRAEALFSGKTGEPGTIYRDMRRTEKVDFQYGIVKLPKLNTWEEREQAHSLPGPDDFSLPILSQIIDNEAEWLRHNKGWRR
jgi:hypothetical protein